MNFEKDPEIYAYTDVLNALYGFANGRSEVAGFLYGVEWGTDYGLANTPEGDPQGTPYEGEGNIKSVHAVSLDSEGDRTAVQNSTLPRKEILSKEVGELGITRVNTLEFHTHPEGVDDLTFTDRENIRNAQQRLKRDFVHVLATPGNLKAAYYDPQSDEVREAEIYARKTKLHLWSMGFTNKSNETQLGSLAKCASQKLEDQDFPESDRTLEAFARVRIREAGGKATVPSDEFSNPIPDAWQDDIEFTEKLPWE